MACAEAQVREILPCYFSLGFLPTHGYMMTHLFAGRILPQTVLKADLTPEMN